MKRITIELDDALHALLVAEAARRGETVPRLVEAALRLLPAEPHERTRLPPLPVFESGGFLVDIADRDALYEALGGR